MKYFLLAAAICFLSACNEPIKESSKNNLSVEGSEDVTMQNQTDLIDDFNKTFKGFIDNQYEIILNLRLEGENITGSYYYTKHSKSIELKGTFNNGLNTFRLEEFSKGEKTGIFIGEIDKNFNLKGSWSAFSKAPEREKTLSFEASETNRSFDWYGDNLPFHPILISQLLGMGDEIEEVDIFSSTALPEGYSLYEGEFPSGYTIDYEDDFVMRTPYFEYDFLGKKDNLYVVSISECGGGTGIFSSVMILQLDGVMLKRIKSVCGGDRCNGGITSSAFQNGKIYYSQNVTSEDLYVMADENIEKPQVSLDYCAMCCVGEANYEYDIEKNKTSFISFETYMESPEIDPEEVSELNLFYQFLFSHQEAAGGKLNQKQLDDFVIEFIQFINQ